MKPKTIFKSIGIAAILCFGANHVFAQFSVSPTSTVNDRWGTTNNPNQINTIRRVGIGDFTAYGGPRALFHVNEHLLTPLMGNASNYFTPGHLFRTDGRANFLNQWQMFTGNNMNFTTEKGKIFNYGNNPVFFNDRDNFSIQATAAHLTFHTGTTDANGVAAERMRIVGGTGPTAGFVGIGTRNPQSELHVHDGTTTFAQFTTTQTTDAANRGFFVGVTAATAVLNQREDGRIDIFTTAGSNNTRRMRIWHNALNEPRVGIGTVANPRTYLHVGDELAFVAGNTQGFRDWMNKGLLCVHQHTNASPPINDVMYVGLWERGNDRIDAIINWGNNPTTQATLADRLRFVFTAGNDLGLPASDVIGLEAARIASNGTLTFYGIGDFETPNIGLTPPVFDPRRQLDVYDDGVNHLGGRPQLRLSQELNADIALGNFTDFQTTGNNNSYDGDGMGLEGHLLINPRSKNGMRVVGINIIDNGSLAVPNPNLALDVNGQLNIRTVDFDDQIDKVLVWDETNGRVKWRDDFTPGPGTADHDWYDFNNQNVAPDDINDDKYTFGRIYINVPLNQIPNYPHVRFGVFSNTGVNNQSITSEQLNSYIHTALFSSAYGLKSTANGSGSGGCIDMTSNYGGYFIAENASKNYGGYFKTGHNPCGTLTNYAIWAETDPIDGLAGNFVGNVVVTGTATVGGSDIKLKKNITPIQNTLDKIRAFSPYFFNFRTNDFPSLNLADGTHYGFIAQDLETIYPDLITEVHFPAQYDSIGNIISDTVSYKAINYTELIPILAQGIKELAEITDSLSNLPQGEDKDWEHIAGTGVFSGHQNNNDFNNESVFVGFQPAWVPYLETPVKLGVYADQGGIGTNNEYGLVTAGFRNMMVHSNSPNSVTNAYGVFSDSRGDGCNIRTSSNYGIRAQADNAKNNYGGFFRAYAQNMCSFNNYAVYADCPIDDSKNNFAGYFNGNLAYTGNLSYQSDIMLKENIVPVANAIDVLNQLNPVSFNFKTAQFPTMNMPAGTHFGLIAQEVEPLIPEVVSNNFFPAQYDDNGTMLSDTFTYKSIDYTKLIPHMIEAIKELSQQNQDLQNQLTQMQDIIASCCNEARSSSVNVTIETRPVVVPAQNTTLNQNYPNPFKTITTFTYTLGESGNCELVIEDTYGRTVATLVSEPQQTGNYSVEWEASSQPAGLYFYSLRVNGKVLVKKAIKIE